MPDPEYNLCLFQLENDNWGGNHAFLTVSSYIDFRYLGVVKGIGVEEKFQTCTFSLEA